MQDILALLSKQGGAAVVSGLPVCSFAMNTQYEIAFRALQGGLIMGKVVVRTIFVQQARKNHIVTGGTAGLELELGTSMMLTRSLTLSSPWRSR